MTGSLNKYDIVYTGTERIWVYSAQKEAVGLSSTSRLLCVT